MQMRHSIIVAAAALTLLAVASGAVSADTLNGGSGGDRLTGRAGASTINGRGGADVLYGDPVAGMGAPRKIERVSLGTNNQQGDVGSTLMSPGNGRYVLFTSLAQQFLPAGQTSNYSQLYMKDLVTNKLTLVSADGGGKPMESHTWHGAAISPNGRYVAYVTTFGFAHEQIILKDLTTGSHRLMSRNLQGVGGNGYCRNPVFSPDGTLLAFESHASDLVIDDTNTVSDVFVVKLAEPQKVYLASMAADGMRATGGGSVAPFFSPDSKMLGFESRGAGLLGNGSIDKNINGSVNESDVFLKSMTGFDADGTMSGYVRMISTDGNNVQLATGGSHSGSFSPDGREVAFLSSANLVMPDASPTGYDIYIKTIEAGGPRPINTIRRVSVSAAGEQLNGTYEQPAVFSPDGTRLAFLTTATNIKPGLTNSHYKVVVKDLTVASGTGTIALVAGADGPLTQSSEGPLLFVDHGTRLVFASYSPNLAGNDTNGSEDVFIATLAAPARGADTISGGKGKDVLIGGPGPDVLVGGPGADRFVYLSTADSPRRASKRDTIRDFNANQGDIIDLSAIDANPAKAGNQAFTFIGAKPFDGKRGRLRFASGVLSADLNGDRRPDFAINVRVTGGKLTSRRIRK